MTRWFARCARPGTASTCWPRMAGRSAGTSWRATLTGACGTACRILDAGRRRLVRPFRMCLLTWYRTAMTGWSGFPGTGAGDAGVTGGRRCPPVARSLVSGCGRRAITDWSLRGAGAGLAALAAIRLALALLRQIDNRSRVRTRQEAVDPLLDERGESRRTPGRC
jgi:hypothetical protein